MHKKACIVYAYNHQTDQVWSVFLAFGRFYLAIQKMCILILAGSDKDRSFRYLQVKFKKKIITRTWTSQRSFLAFKSELRIFHWYCPGPSQLDSYSRALLVMQDRRHLFVTPCFLVMNSENKSNARLLFFSVWSFFLFVTILHVSVTDIEKNFGNTKI